MMLTDLEAVQLGGISREALLQHRSRASRGRSVSLEEQGVRRTAQGIRYDPQVFLVWITRLRGEEELRRHLARLDKIAMDLLNGGRDKPIEDPAIEHQAHTMAASLAGYDDRLLAAKTLALGEAIVKKLRLRIDHNEALAYASAVMRRVGYLVAEQRKQKKSSSRLTSGKLRGRAK